ncbi:hypothetical protein CEK62_19060 [Alcanivorax sp. N3-2A]|nr:hypothetical protein CEK62_19060 [Alcanivorax sp. N3-2A]
MSDEQLRSSLLPVVKHSKLNCSQKRYTLLFSTPLQNSVATFVTWPIRKRQKIEGKRIKWLILPLHESETDRHLIGLSG